MSRFDPLALVCGLAALLAFGLTGLAVSGPLDAALSLGLVSLIASAIARLRLRARRFEVPLAAIGTGLVALALVAALPGGGEGHATAGLVAAMVAAWLGAWRIVNAIITSTPKRGALRMSAHLAAPVIFGATLLFLWECVTRGFGVPPVILPPPSAIAARFAGSLPTLGVDFPADLARGRGRLPHRLGHRPPRRHPHRPRAFLAARPSCRSAISSRPCPSSASLQSW